MYMYGLLLTYSNSHKDFRRYVKCGFTLIEIITLQGYHVVCFIFQRGCITQWRFPRKEINKTSLNYSSGLFKRKRIKQCSRNLGEWVLYVLQR